MASKPLLVAHRPRAREEAGRETGRAIKREGIEAAREKNTIYCKIKGVFDYYSVMNNWTLEIIGFVIWNLFTKWFWRRLDSQVT
uniref:Uncharacterized protein n=1 Tax=Oryza sativa subsp. japonica TaxID=39947 RepID=Q10PE2_ORYSJ|nr:hypothetical protein LOC_Os03g13440 [Oryza sativa Japonica Group]